MPKSRSEGRDIDRFVRAQANGEYDRALEEIRSGRKRGHWMWFIFPQAAGLGYSAASQYYGIKSIGEAWEYLSHPVLGPRLREITEVLLEVPDFEPAKMFGYPDNLKLLSSLTLFDLASPNDIFARAIAKCFDNSRDEKTVGIISDWEE